MDKYILIALVLFCATAFTVLFRSINNYYIILFSLVAMIYLLSECAKYIVEVKQ